MEKHAPPQHHCHSEQEAKTQPSSCCAAEQQQASSCHVPEGKIDKLFWGSLIAVAFLYLHYAFFFDLLPMPAWYVTLAASVFELSNTMWWGVVLGILMLAVLAKIPREFVMSVLGAHSGLNGIMRATAAGVLLDLCNHGILMVGAKLYERGASIGQVVAFLLASPWNSFSLTLILVALVGLKWTLAFVVLSMLIAVIAGLIFDVLVTKQILPNNPHKIDLPEDFNFWKNARSQLAATDFTPEFVFEMLRDGIKDSKMIVRWILFGIVLAGLIRAFIPAEHFETFFGPSLMGLALTVVAATVMEVCSEGSTPIAADLLTKANAPGNSFAFLMTGVSTDYTEIMVIKDTTQSWKIALFLPLITVPQVLLVAWLINSFI